MKTELKSRLITRLSLGVLALGLLGGVFAAGAMLQDNAGAQGASSPPGPRVTAYVDFLALLKEDRLLLAEQFETSQGVQTENNRLEATYIPLIQQEQRNKRNFLPDSRQHRRAMEDELRLVSELYKEQLLLEQQASKHLRDFGILRFKELRELATRIALDRGYNEVLNIVREIEDVAGQQDDFQSLQQQLLVSPVLYFEESHDITDAVFEAAKEKWGSEISMPNDISFTLEDEQEPLKVNDDDELEIRFGQKGSFHVDVADKGEVLPPEHESARVKWSKTGFFVGELGEDGVYTAPDEWPSGSDDTFTVTARCAKDPSVNRSITVRLLDAEGNRKAEGEKEEGESAEGETEEE